MSRALVVFLLDKETRQLRIQIVRGNWELEHDVVTVSRALQPEGRVVNPAFLMAQRKTVENGILHVGGVGYPHRIHDASSEGGTRGGPGIGATQTPWRGFWNRPPHQASNVLTGGRTTPPRSPAGQRPGAWHVGSWRPAFQCPPLITQKRVRRV